MDGGAAGCRQHRYSGETSPNAGSQMGGRGEGAALTLGLGAEGPGLPSRLVL